MKKSKILALVLCLTLFAFGSVVSAATLLVENTCEEPRQTVKVEPGAPDGTNFYQTTYAEIDLPGLAENSMEDLIWAIDIRFDAEEAGFTPMSTNVKWGTCVRSKTMDDGVYTLVIQTGGSSWDTYFPIDTTTWYHIELAGSFSTEDGQIDMTVWEYDADGNKTNEQKFENVNRRNFWGGNFSGAAFVKVNPNTSVDNVNIYKQ